MPTAKFLKIVSKTKWSWKKKFVALLLHKHIATVSGMFKSGGSAKTVFSLLLFRNYVELVIFVFGSLFINIMELVH